MPLDPGMLRTLPDSALQQAISSQGSIPSWAALAELSRRNNVRASAPVQQPQGTVAQSVVRQALAQFGAMPVQSQGGQGIGSPSPTNAPGLSGIGGGMQTPGFAKGGAVRFADGGSSTGIGAGLASNPEYAALKNLGIVPDLQNLTAQKVNYNPQYTPNGLTLQDAQSQIAPTFGQSPDYVGDLDQINQNIAKNGRIPFNVGDYIKSFVGNAASAKGNPLQAFGAGLTGADNMERSVQQQNFQNADAGVKAKLEVQKTQDARSQAVAEAARKYQELNAQIADSQEARRTAVEQGNADRVAQIDRDNQDNKIKQSQLLQQGIEHAGNPVTANVLSNMAAQSGDAAGAKFFKDAHDAAMTNAQQQSDIVQKRETAVQKAKTQAEFGMEMAKLQQEHINHMTEQGMNPDGTMDIKYDSEGKPIVSALAKAIGDYDTRGPSAMAMTKPQAKMLMAEVKAYRPSWREGNYDLIQNMLKNSQTGPMSNQLNASNAAIGHLDLLEGLHSALNNGDNNAYNEVSNKWKAAFGSAAPRNYESAATQVAGELTAALKRGVPDRDTIEAIAKNITNGSSNQQSKGFTDTQLGILGTKLAAQQYQFRQAIGAANNEQIPPSMQDRFVTPEARQVFLKHGFDPDHLERGKISSRPLSGNHVMLKASDGSTRSVLVEEADALKKKGAVEFTPPPTPVNILQ